MIIRMVRKCLKSIRRKRARRRSLQRRVRDCSGIQTLMQGAEKSSCWNTMNQHSLLSTTRRFSGWRRERKQSDKRVPKSAGSSIMIIGFVCSCQGFMSGNVGFMQKKNSKCVCYWQIYRFTIHIATTIHSTKKQHFWFFVLFLYDASIRDRKVPHSIQKWTVRWGDIRWEVTVQVLWRLLVHDSAHIEVLYRDAQENERRFLAFKPVVLPFSSLQMTNIPCHIEYIVIHHEQTAAIDASCRRGHLSVKKGLGRLNERAETIRWFYDTQWPIVDYRCRPLYAGWWDEMGTHIPVYSKLPPCRLPGYL